VINRCPGDSVDDDRTLASPNPPRPATRTRWAIVSIYSATLVVMALIPSIPTVGGIAVPDWLAHGLAYGLLAGLILWGSSPSVGTVGAVMISLLGAGALGLVTEALQWLQPARSAELRDLVADLAGAAVVCGIASAVLFFHPGRSR
jgi:VanZ family protein